MNPKRIAALLRELADAFEAEEPKRKRAKRVAAPEVEPTQEAKDAARRALRKAGFAA
jgi:hypothetical protein